MLHLHGDDDDYELGDPEGTWQDHSSNHERSTSVTSDPELMLVIPDDVPSELPPPQPPPVKSSCSHLFKGTHFHLHTDHRNLLFMAKCESPKVTRWLLCLQEYDYTLHHVAGRLNLIADILSRMHHDDPDDKSQHRHKTPVPMSYLQLDDNTEVDAASIFAPPISAETPEPPSNQPDVPHLHSERRARKVRFNVHLSYDDADVRASVPRRPVISFDVSPLPKQSIPTDLHAYLKYCEKQEPQLDLPEEIISTCRQYHNDGIGHHGISRTLTKLRNRNKYWPTMRADVARFIHACPICQKVWIHARPPVLEEHTLDVYEPFQVC